MEDNLNIGSFSKFAEEYAPFEWEMNEDAYQEDIRGKHSILITRVQI